MFVKVEGTFMGYIDFNGKRYWTHDKMAPFKPTIIDNGLPSDHSRREDRIQLMNGDMRKAQEGKEMLEEKQRRDAKLRLGNVNSK